MRSAKFDAAGPLRTITPTTLAIKIGPGGQPSEMATRPATPSQEGIVWNGTEGIDLRQSRGRINRRFKF